MIYSILADIVVFVHFLFVVFAVIGGIFVFKWRRVIYPHLISAFWAAMVISMGWICPLTPIENRLRRTAGEAGYSGGFIEHYFLPVIYPDGLTREIQIWLGISVILINACIYSVILYKRLKSA